MSERYQLLCRRVRESGGHPVTVSAAAPEDPTRPAAVQGESQVQRREFLTASAAVAGSLTMPPQLAQLAVGRRIGADVPEALARRLARLRRLDNYLGGGETYHLYAAELDATKTLSREAACTQNIRRELLAVLSEQAQQAGWAAFDAGWQATARTLYQESLTAAQSSGNRALEGNALALLAYQNLTTGEPAVPFADASCEAAGPRTPSRVRALLHERRAWAIAHSAGGQDEARRALDRAAVALEEPDSEPVPDWAAWVDHAELKIMTGRCLTRTGQRLQAIAILRGALDQFDETQARDKALYMSWLAEAYLDAGEIDAAAETAGQALVLSVDVASVRPAERLCAVLRRLSRYPATASVADLLDRVPRATSGLLPG
jgi:tetratricopeptide (TPR) repeat protein